MQMSGRMDSTKLGKTASTAASARQRRRQSKPLSKPSSTKKRRSLRHPKPPPSDSYPESDSRHRCSSPFRSVEGRPPRHPDSPLSTSSSDAALFMEWNVPTDLYILNMDGYKNEKFPAEILARIERKHEKKRTIVADEQRDEDEHRSLNDMMGRSIHAKESEVQEKESICEFFSPILNLFPALRHEPQSAFFDNGRP